MVRQDIFRQNYLFTMLLVVGTVVSSVCAWAQSQEDPAAKIQVLSSQSQKLMEQYSRDKQRLENELRQKLSALTRSSGDRVRRRQWMDEANQKLQELQRKFQQEMDEIQLSQRGLIDAASPSVSVQSRGKKKGFTAAELKEKIARQEEEDRRNPEFFSKDSNIFAEEKKEANVLPQIDAKRESSGLIVENVNTILESNVHKPESLKKKKY